ncbi:MAG TPA: DNA-binding protein, partial [Acidimicrobiales bacterium]
MVSAGDDVLTSAHVLEYPYSRSVGPVIGAFLTGLRDGKIIGAKGTGGRVIVPPTEYDPQTAEATGELVEVGPEGTVTTW